MDAVRLRGVVPSPEAGRRAVELTRDTFGVTGVVDELTTLVPEKTETIVVPADTPSAVPSNVPSPVPPDSQSDTPM